MTNLTNILTDLIAERDDIHPAHAANRVALAIRVVEAAESLAQFTAYGYIADVLAGRTDLRATLTAAVAPAMGTLSNDTLRLALQIAA